MDTAYLKWERRPNDDAAKEAADKAGRAWSQAGSSLRMAIGATENARRLVALYGSDAEFTRRLAVAERHARVPAPHHVII